jgi:hypothetical protein
MNVEIGTVAAQIPFWEYFFPTFFSLQYLCSVAINELIQYLHTFT